MSLAVIIHPETECNQDDRVSDLEFFMTVFGKKAKDQQDSKEMLHADIPAEACYIRDHPNQDIEIQNTICSKRFCII
jgi:hypothetical protein